MKLVVGCPIYNRAWIFGRWLEHLNEWTQHGVSLHFVFVTNGTPDHDDSLGLAFDLGRVDLIPGQAGDRGWEKKERVELLAGARNALKRLARHELGRIGGDYFLSLDSDILVSPWEESRVLFDDLQGKDAVSPLAYLGERESNAFSFPVPGRPARRLKPLDALQHADVLCAAILMSRKLVLDPRVEYGYHPLGEDFFWSAQARANRYDLALDSRVKWKHVMQKEWLDTVDRRIGW